MNRINWAQLAFLGLVALLVLLLGASWRGSYGGWGAWPGMMGPGMMGAPGGLPGFAPFGWIFILLGPLVPLGLLTLLALGIVWLVRQAGGSAEPVAGPSQTHPERTCPNCGRAVQTGWRLCPYCGQSLSQTSGETSVSPTKPLHA